MIILQLTGICSKVKCWLACAGLLMAGSLQHELASWTNLLIHSLWSCMPRLGPLKSPGTQVFAAPDCTFLQLFSAESSMLVLKHQPFGIATIKLNLASTDGDSLEPYFFLQLYSVVCVWVKTEFVMEYVNFGCESFPVIFHPTLHFWSWKEIKVLVLFSLVTLIVYLLSEHK